jgi:HK97 gp10 family phage protein
MTIKGLASLNRKFERLPKSAEDAARKAIAISADEIVAMAKRLVPVDEGDLRASIGWTWGEAPEGTKVLGSARGGAALTATIFAGDHKAFYARWIEFGTVKMSAHPYFFPSYRANAKRAKSRIKRAINKAAKANAA